MPKEIPKEQAHYRHDLGMGFYLDAYAIDPKLTEGNLGDLVKGNKRTAKLDLDSIGKQTLFKGRVNSLDELEIKVSDKNYEVPKQLQDYRSAIGATNDAIEGRYNGPIAIVDGPLQNPLKVFPGGFYDFVSTKLDTVPAELEKDLSFANTLFPFLDETMKSITPESFGYKQVNPFYEKIKDFADAYELIKGKYPEGMTVEELFKQWGVDNEKRARYLGISYTLLTSDGGELSLVQRAKGMAIAADCMSGPGSTPNPPLKEPGFNFKDYLKNHVVAEMGEEYKMSAEEFGIENIFLFDDKREVPVLSIEIKTPQSTANLAKRIYGDKGAIKEHPVLYSFSPHALDIVINQLDVFPPVAHIMKIGNQNR